MYFDVLECAGVRWSSEAVVTIYGYGQVTGESAHAGGSLCKIPLEVNDWYVIVPLNHFKPASSDVLDSKPGLQFQNVISILLA